MRVRYHTVDVFTDQRFGGNPLAVFPDASAIPPDLLQPIAREFNYSETTFVYPPTDAAHTRRVRIFGPARELPFAGHPTVGTAHVLAATGAIPLTGDETRVVFEEGVGPVGVSIRARGGSPTFAQLSVAQLPEIGPPPPPRDALAAMLSLSPDDLAGDAAPPEAISCGNPFLLVPLRDRGAVARSRARADTFDEVLGDYWTNKVMVFALGGQRPGADVRARMFAPGVGVAEDPATGSAAVGVGAYLAARHAAPDGTLRWTIEQGVEMGRPSVLEVEVDKARGAITAVRVGGRSVLVCEGHLHL